MLNSKCAPSNKNNFKMLFQDYEIEKLREAVYLHIISSEESDYFVVEPQNKKYISTIMSELKELGWNVVLTYGGSGLFIYEKERPRNCVDSQEI